MGVVKRRVLRGLWRRLVGVGIIGLGLYGVPALFVRRSGRKRYFCHPFGRCGLAPVSGTVSPRWAGRVFSLWACPPSPYWPRCCLPSHPARPLLCPVSLCILCTNPKLVLAAYIRNR